MTCIEARPTASFRLVALLAGISVLTAALHGCLSPEQAVAEVDAEAYGIIGERQEQLLGTTADFTIEPPIDRVMATAIDPQTGLARADVTVSLTLEDALRLAAVNSREFQTQKERLYRAALALMRQRENFRTFPFAFLSGTARAFDNTESLGADGGFGLTQMLQRGGEYALDLGLNYLRIVSGGPDTLLSSTLALSISLPFLRNAGLEIVTENLTQASRDVLYALRDFERFKQTYGVQVISGYLGVLTVRQRERNSVANVESLTYARERNEARFKEGRIDIVEVDQARQRELQAENQLIVATQSSARLLDSFKNLIGLPVDVAATVRMEDLDGLQDLLEENLEFDEAALTALALRCRLDFRNAVDIVSDAIRRVKVAENQLLPDLSLGLSASAESENLKPLKYNFQNGLYTATVDFDPGLDRDLESISLRQALIDLQVALRAQEAAADAVKLDVRNSLRRLRVASETYEINLSEVALAENRVASSRALLDLGRATTRDFLDSQDDLLRSQNLLVEALVEYRISYLELLSDTGVLLVTPGGLDHETTRALLEVDYTLTATALLAAAGLCASCDDSEDQLGMRVATARAARGNLRVTVTEGGELESANPVTLRSEVEGRTTIIWLVEEGTVVKKDDVVVRLDRAELEDRMEQRELDVERARSELAQAVEAVEIQKKKNSEEVRDAQTKLALAINALEAYKEGTFLLERRQLEAAVTLAKERYARAKDEAEASARLFEQKFLSRTELEADDLAEKTAAEEVMIAEGRLEQLEKWEREAELLKLQSDLDVRRLALERMKQQAESELKQKEDLLANRQRSYDLQVERRDKVVEMLDKSVITAPADGLVVYSRERSRWGRGDPVSEGKEVKEREEILRIPDLSRMLVKVDIHESSIKRVQIGQRATIEVDAIPGRRFAGTVSRVSPVPSSESSWMNPDLKVYETEVVLDETIDEMKPGMHARVQIMVSALDGALMVPLQAVREAGRRSFVYVKKGQEIELREVKTGMEDDVAIQINSGLEEGEEVFLATPAGAPGLPEPAPAGPPPGAVPAKTEVPAVGGAPAPAAGAGSPAADAEQARPSRRRGENMTPEQLKALQERMKNMTPEERAKMRERRGRSRPEQDDD